MQPSLNKNRLGTRPLRTSRGPFAFWLPLVLGVAALCLGKGQAQSPGTTPADHEEGKTLYTQNCFACHAPNGVRVGPSLLEIAFLYKGKPEGIVEWSIKPGRKRNQMIPMPPMAHLAQPKLEQIANYILFATKGKKIGKDGVSKKTLMPPTGNIQRILMPDSGPASIAVKLSDQMAYCWDAGACRLRYVWTGGFISHTWGSGFLGHQDGNDRRYSFEQAVLQGLPFYTSGDRFPLRLGDLEANPEYLGYKLNTSKRPRFLYRIHGQTVTESLSALPDDQGIVRRFEIPGNDDPVFFTRTAHEGVTWSSDRGEWEGAVLKLTAEEAREFSVSIIKKEQEVTK